MTTPYLKPAPYLLMTDLKDFVCFVHNSIKHPDEKNPNCEGGGPMEVPGDFDNEVSIVYSFSVTFEVSLQTTFLIICY